jgi:anti-sigma regulatory factor (Ser/Thr protein kinase)
VAGTRTDALDLTVPADMAGVADMLERVRATLAAWPVTETAANEVLVIAEELAINIVRHAWGGERGHQFSFRMSLEPGAAGADVVLGLADDGPPFDPTLHVPVGMDETLETRRAGGVGIALVRAFASDFSYVRAAGANRVRVSRPAA